MNRKTEDPLAPIRALQESMTELTGHVRSIRRQLDVIARDSAELSVLINDQFDSMRVLLDDIRKEIREAISERENAR